MQIFVPTLETLKEASILIRFISTLAGKSKKKFYHSSPKLLYYNSGAGLVNIFYRKMNLSFIVLSLDFCDNTTWERERGQWTVYYTNAMFYNNAFLFVSFTTLGTWVNLTGWLIKLSVQTFQHLILSIIIGDVYQFTGHCLILFDPWQTRESKRWTKYNE